MRSFPAWLCVLALALVQPSLSHAFQRMGVLAPQTFTVPPGGQANLSARCLDETASPPLTSDSFTKVLHGGASSATVSRSGQQSSFAAALREGWITVSGELTEQQVATFARDLQSGRYDEEELVKRSYQLYDAVVVHNETLNPLTIRITAPIVLGGASSSEYAFNPIPLISENQTAVHSRVSEAERQAEAAADAKARADEANRVRQQRETARRALPPLFDSLDPVIATDVRRALEVDASMANWRETFQGKVLLERLYLLKRQAVGLGVSADNLDTESAAFVDELQKVSTGDRIDLDAVGRRFEAEVRQLQIMLNLSGLGVAVDGKYGPPTAAALRRFQLANGFPSTGIVDAATGQRLQRAYQAATDYVSFAVSLSDLPGGTALPELKAALRLNADYLLDESTKSAIDDLLTTELKEPREQLDRIGYDAPITNDVDQWSDVVKAFRVDAGLPETIAPALDTNARTILSQLHALALETAAITWADSGWSESRPTIFPMGVEHSTYFFRTPTRFAEQVEKTLNRAIGENIVKLQRATEEFTVFALADTRGYLRETLRDLIRTEKLGVGLASNNGVAIHAPLLDNGVALLQTVSGDTSELEIVDSVWTRVWKMFGVPSSLRAVQSQAMEQLIARQIQGRDVVFVQSNDELAGLPIERISKVPVIRSAVEGRSIDELVARVEAATRVPFSAANTSTFVAVPTSAERFAALKTEAGLQGDYETAWQQPVANVMSLLRERGFKPTEGSSRISARLQRALSKDDNVIIVIAHADGGSIYFPTSSGVEKVSVNDLSAVAQQIKENAPTVLLLACNTGSTKLDYESFGQGLVRLGAGLVIAPTETLLVTETEDFLAAFLRHADNLPLIEAAFQAMDDQGFMERDALLRFLVKLRGEVWYERS